MRRSALLVLVAMAFSCCAATVLAQNQQCPANNQQCAAHKQCPANNHHCSQCQKNDEGCGIPEEDSAHDVAPLTPAPDFLAFTGKVVKNKVRLRHQPSLDSPILKELNHGDMLIVVGETEDFYAVQPPNGTKAYVFRTYILDNVVEVDRVNVRLEPDLESPIIAKLSQGERIEGTLSPQNNKWIEIKAPNTTRFYIAKEYIEKLGDPSVMTSIQKRRDEANFLLNTSVLASQAEMQKPFPEINLEGAYSNYNRVISSYKEFPEQVAKAQELLASLQDAYLQKKIAFLENKAKFAQEEWLAKNSQLNDQMKAQQQRLAQLEQQIKKEKTASSPQLAQSSRSAGQQNSQNSLNNKMAAWVPVEEALYRKWSADNSNGSMDDFYNNQRRAPVLLKGILEPYTRVIKNKPGDYMLVDSANNLPIAFVYSTHVNLQDLLGKEVTLFTAPRSNNHFAFPAFFVLYVE
jgi:uncharacterized protein YgiM (DUF1202 family)